jgi:8-oxo-dGTP pyrophosphatase MutT (NUDIX family)
MSQPPDRAVAVAFRGDTLLVIGRQREGRAYCVMPGGGVEPGEAPDVAVLRELAEETGLTGTVLRPLWTVEHDDRRAHYFLVEVESGCLSLGGPEALAQSTTNVYVPKWLPLHLLKAEDLQPASMRERLQTVKSEVD